MLARLDKPLRLTVRPRRQKRNWGGPSLQSLLKMSHGATRSTRGGEPMLVEAMGTV
jgi:hypothetical protein